MRVNSQNGFSLKYAWFVLVKLYIALFIFSATFFLLFITPALAPGLWPYLLSCAGIILYMLTAQSENFRLVTKVSIQPIALLLSLIMALSLFVVRDILIKLIPLPSFEAVNFSSVRIDSVPAIIGSVFLLPLLEEVLFRGIILEALSKKYPPSFALVQSSVIYAVATLNPVYIIPNFLLAMLCGLFYLKLRDLCIPVFIHMAGHIAMAFVMAKGHAGLAELLGKGGLHFSMVLAAFVLLPLGYYLLERVNEAGRLPVTFRIRGRRV
ncbi:type II CAAX endopeptidase family protein [uncultured Chitinophaga sp.]|uniref:CPBP family intramembrane glutamic endopeptidase n=1 Tax=uncultured Chitinophaga sp. TaxID=339340 RepID=UPI0025F71CD2|nr:type II CAAX endopeptidase family protein [uncultured Chitinophaga sp.]